MYPHIKDQLSVALRSGDYQQGRLGFLHYEEDGHHSYCINGVLCELAYQSGLGTRKVVQQDDVTIYAYGHDFFDEHLYDTQFLPWAVVFWAGLKGVHVTTGESSTAMNDEGYASFTDFAAINDGPGYQLGLSRTPRAHHPRR